MHTSYTKPVKNTTTLYTSYCCMETSPPAGTAHAQINYLITEIIFCILLLLLLPYRYCYFTTLRTGLIRKKQQTQIKTNQKNQTDRQVGTIHNTFKTSVSHNNTNPQSGSSPFITGNCSTKQQGSSKSNLSLR